MSIWTPEWKLTIDGGQEFTNLTLANLTITSGRTNIYSQPLAGYANFQILNFDEVAIDIDVNDSVNISLKDSSGDFVSLFGGYITDLTQSVLTSGTGGITQTITVIATGALAKLQKMKTLGVLSKDQDGDQIYSILEPLLFNQWNQVAPAQTWVSYNPTVNWTNAANSGLGEIDRPGDYDLDGRASSQTDVYSLVSLLATSGLGYLYEDAQGRICYADSTHRSQYLAANGYFELSANNAYGAGIRTYKRTGDLRNNVTINYKKDQSSSVNAQDADSISLYGEQAYSINTTLEKVADATTQADFYLGLRAYPQAQFDQITFPIANPEIDDSDRDNLLNVFMGQPINLIDLPNNMENGIFQGFVEGWTFRAGYNSLSLSLYMSPLAFSIQSMKWSDVSGAETWNTINTSLEWINATIVA